MQGPVQWLLTSTRVLRLLDHRHRTVTFDARGRANPGHRRRIRSPPTSTTWRRSLPPPVWSHGAARRSPLHHREPERRRRARAGRRGASHLHAHRGRQGAGPPDIPSTGAAHASHRSLWQVSTDVLNRGSRTRHRAERPLRRPRQRIPNSKATSSSSPRCPPTTPRSCPSTPRRSWRGSTSLRNPIPSRAEMRGRWFPTPADADKSNPGPAVLRSEMPAQRPGGDAPGVVGRWSQDEYLGRGVFEQPSQILVT